MSTQIPSRIALVGLTALIATACSVDSPAAQAAAEAGGPITLPHMGGPCLVVVDDTGIVLSGRESGIDPGFRVARSTDGRFFTSARWEQGTVLAFQPDGTYLGRVGEFGEGPGEFGAVGALIPSGDGGVHVFHGNGRWSHVDESLGVTDVGRHQGLSHASQVNTAVVSDSIVVVLGPLVPDRPARGEILRLQGGGLETVASFETGTGAEAQWMALLPPVAWSGTDETFWSGPWISGPDLYRLEERDLTGRVLQTLERRHSWLLPEPNRQSVEGITVFLAPLGPTVALVGAGIPGVGEAPSEAQRTYEVLDLKSGSLLSSGSRMLSEPDSRPAFVGSVSEHAAGSLTYLIRSQREGLPQIHVSKISLSSSPDGSAGSCP